MQTHDVTSSTLGDVASYGALTGKRIRGLQSGIEFVVKDLVDTPTGLVIKVERQDMTPLQRTECQVTEIPWMYRDNYSVVVFAPCDAIGCENGDVWTECCNGSNDCPCLGRQVFFDKCQACGGSGKKHDGPENVERNVNLEALNRAAKASGGYFGNPHGRTR